tara:strand:+ start:4571 stop:5404 length:834 start_codon:yes stop_codon:yes gene_type:complete
MVGQFLKEYLNRAGNYIETNKFSYLDSGNCIFCKTDFLQEDFNRIENLNKKVIVLSGNSDYPIDQWHVENAPKNLFKFYGQNVLCKDPRFIPVPMGVESSVVAKRGINHGVFYDRSKDLQDLLISYSEDQKDVSKASKFIYANYSVYTNQNHRQEILDFIGNIDYINWSHGKSTIDFHKDILDHRITLCPAGNGVDTHRLWEVIYLNRIPLTIKTGDYAIYYDLYKHLPIIILDSIEELADFDYIHSLYEKVKYNSTEKAYFDYWKNIIIAESKSLN